MSVRALVVRSSGDSRMHGFHPCNDVLVEPRLTLGPPDAGSKLAAAGQRNKVLLHACVTHRIF